MLLAPALQAQKGSIRGFVTEQETGEPVIFTNVYLYRTSFGSTTDETGYFNISGVIPGNYDLMVTSIGYDTLKMPVSVKGGDILTLKLQLTQASISLTGAKVTADKEEARTETKISVSRVTPAQIKQIPTIGGQADLVQYLQVLPGIIFSGDQGGQLYVRGGPPIQNKVIIDGMTVFNPFHSIGLFSVFETDIIRNIDVYTGGFNSEYGGRVSSIMDITTKDGNKRRLSGKVGANTINTSLLLEGPVTEKRKSQKDVGTSFILSAKKSYIEQTSRSIYDYIDEHGLPYNYTDLYGKIAFYPSELSRVNIYGFHYTDEVNNFRELANFGWKSTGLGSNFLIIPGKSPVKIEGFLAYSKYKIDMDEFFNPDRSSSVSSMNMGVDFKYFFGKDVMQYGIDLSGGSTYYEYLNSENEINEMEDNSTEVGVYVKYKKTLGKMLLEPGFRLQWYASLSQMSPEPRLAAKYNLRDDFRIKLAAGLYSQNLVAAVSDRDIVNLFYGFLSGVTNVPPRFNGKAVNSSLQKARHIILGFEYDLNAFITVNIEGYYKKYPQLTNFNRDKIFDELDALAEDKPDILKKVFILEEGDAQGVEFSLRAEKERVSLWLAYAYAFVNRYYETVDEGLKSYYPHFDRRHNLNFVGGYRFGRGYNWEAFIRWNFGTGFPFTPTQLYYEQIPMADEILSNYLHTNGNLGFLYGEWNEKRLPPYHRLDFSIKKRFNFNEHVRLDLDFSIINVYNRENIFYIDRVTNKRINQLPFLPGLGASFSF